jgi:cation transport protein ChaC
MRGRAAEVEVDWVFGYGSLIWDHAELVVRRAEPGRVHGYHRAFCVRSSHYRGTPERPGLVLGLDRGGSCQGMVFLLDAAQRRQSIERVFEREMPADQARVYEARILRVHLASGVSVRALAFVADRSLPSYARLPEDETVLRLGACAGRRGPNSDYAINTWEALRRHGVNDERLGAIVRRLRDADCAPTTA